jgi:hypothetical protein
MKKEFLDALRNYEHFKENGVPCRLLLLPTVK